MHKFIEGSSGKGGIVGLVRRRSSVMGWGRLTWSRSRRGITPIDGGVSPVHVAGSSGDSRNDNPESAALSGCRGDRWMMGGLRKAHGVSAWMLASLRLRARKKMGLWLVYICVNLSFVCVDVSQW